MPNWITTGLCARERPRSFTARERRRNRSKKSPFPSGKKVQNAVLITRMAKEAADLLSGEPDFTYYPLPKVGILGSMPPASGVGKIVVATGGTSDMPVAEEAAPHRRGAGK